MSARREFIVRVPPGLASAFRNHCGPELERKKEELKIKKSEESSARRLKSYRCSFHMPAREMDDVARTEKTEKARMEDRMMRFIGWEPVKGRAHPINYGKMCQRNFQTYLRKVIRA